MKLQMVVQLKNLVARPMKISLFLIVKIILIWNTNETFKRDNVFNTKKVIIGGNKHVNTWIGKIGVDKGLQQIGYGCNYALLVITWSTSRKATMV